MQFLKKFQNNHKRKRIRKNPPKWRGRAWYYSEGFYRFFKTQTLIGTFPNYNQIYSKHYEIKYNSKFELKKKKGGFEQFSFDRVTIVQMVYLEERQLLVGVMVLGLGLELVLQL